MSHSAPNLLRVSLAFQGLGAVRKAWWEDEEGPFYSDLSHDLALLIDTDAVIHYNE